MSPPRRYLLISLLIALALSLGWFMLRSSPPQVPEAIKHGYAKALEQARNGQGARLGCFISNWRALT